MTGDGFGRGALVAVGNGGGGTSTERIGEGGGTVGFFLGVESAFALLLSFVLPRSAGVKFSTGEGDVFAFTLVTAL